MLPPELLCHAVTKQNHKLKIRPIKNKPKSVARITRRSILATFVFAAPQSGHLEADLAIILPQALQGISLDFMAFFSEILSLWDTLSGL